MPRSSAARRVTATLVVDRVGAAAATRMLRRSSTYGVTFSLSRDVLGAVQVVGVDGGVGGLLVGEPAALAQVEPEAAVVRVLAAAPADVGDRGSSAASP